MPATLPSISALPIGQMLVGRGVIRPEQLDRALAEQRRGRHRKLLGEIFIDLRDCTEQQVAEALAEAYGVPFARVASRLADPKALCALPADFLEKRQVLPLFLVDGVLTVAMSEPANVFLIEEIERRAAGPVQIVAATASDIRAALRDALLGDRAFTVDEVTVEQFRLTPPALARGALREGSGPADKLLIFCLYSAAKQGAASVHFEPTPEAMRIRFRLDGVLVEKLHPPPRLHAPLAERLKVAAGLDPAQCRLPQHGPIRAEIDGRQIEMQASTAPGRCGETLVVRLHEPDKAPASLEKLGFTYDMLKQWRRLLGLPGGLLLVAGPGDSGKRTTLCSSLEFRNSPGANLCTVEDPIRLAITGVNQFQVDPATGFTAEVALEAIMRQRPDVVMLGNLPDAGTARLAAQAALNGRLVLAGLPARDAPTALSLLNRLGLDPCLVASSVAAVLCQRLARKLCQSCRKPYEPTGAEKRHLDRLLPGVTTLYRPKGCDRCRHTGYAGRIGLFELLVPTDTFIDNLAAGPTLSELRRLSKDAGLTTLKADGLEKARAGITTLEEIYRVTG